MDDLAAFLAARADELEAAAKAWLPLGNPDAAQRESMARHDPGRALALAAFTRSVADNLADDGDLKLSGHADYHHGYANGHASASRAIALWLARIWNDHPDFVPKWKPA